MKTLFAFFALFAITLAGKADQTGQEKCDGVVISLPADVKKVGKECDDEFFGEQIEFWAKVNSGDLNPTKEERDAMFEKAQPITACANVCKGKGLGIINPDGQMNLTKLEEMTGRLIPSTDIVKSLMAGIKPCISAQPNLILNEETCETSFVEIMKFLVCAEESTQKVCKFARPGEKI